MSCIPFLSLRSYKHSRKQPIGITVMNQVLLAIPSCTVWASKEMVKRTRKIVFYFPKSKLTNFWSACFPRYHCFVPLRHRSHLLKTSFEIVSTLILVDQTSIPDLIPREEETSDNDSPLLLKVNSHTCTQSLVRVSSL